MKLIISIAAIWFFIQVEPSSGIYKKFCKWNDKTLQSIAQSKKESIGNKAMEKIWDKELKSMKYILYTPTFNDKRGEVKQEPLRLKFLKQNTNLISESKHYIIVETQENGEAIEFINYLILVGRKKCKIAAYRQRAGNWVKTKDTTLYGLSFSTAIKNHNATTISLPVSLSMLIVSDFKDNNVKCNYFSPGSIEVNGSIRRILEIR